MKKIIFLALSAIFLLSVGCANHVTWGHATKNESDYNRDESDCRYEAERSTSYYAPDFPAQFEQAQKKNQLYMMCMKNRGYYVQK